MGAMNVEIWDATGNKRVRAELPDDQAVNKIMILLIDKMNLPRFTPDGQMMSYKFHHKASSRQLLDEETLASAGVHDGDIIRIQPEITAG